MIEAPVRRILGVRVHDVTMGEALRIVEAFLAGGQSHQICTVNPEFVMRAQRDPAFFQTLENADLNVPDGVGLLWAGRVLGQPLRERVPGVELMEALAARAAERGWRIFLLGAAAGVADRAAAVLQARYPGLVVAGTFAGSPRPEDAPAILERLRRARPDLLFVAYGAPQQDLWIARYQPELGIPVAMGIGGAFDFIAGVVPRAPRWMREAGLEWLYRLIRQPWRWRRMLALPQFVLAVLAARYGGGGTGAGAG
ncbi:WecB/TagA/CpsF family glycosyltransferase [Thermoflexus sp.]|uniref:WecB/TagA/CpsF family glycosyltransferase n=1 Tax=Thermoflexus sp. TaxID=1969742 RepID=UPI002ADDD047|nr:WecB/TagA/CpsF family glycosyltransferase [Thermoflexus sp.]